MLPYICKQQPMEKKVTLPLRKVKNALGVRPLPKIGSEKYIKPFKVFIAI